MSQTKAQLISDLVQALNFTGTASAPANGLFLSAANQLKLATASTERLKIDGTEVVVNDTGANVDFRVEGDTSSHLLFLDAGNDRVGIKASSPATPLHVGGTIHTTTNVAIRITSSTNNLHVHQDDSDKSIAQFTNTATGSAAGDGFQIGLASSEDGLINMKESKSIFFKTADSDAMAIDSSGNVGIGTTTPSAPLTFGKAVYGEPTSEDFFRIKFNDTGGINNDVGIGQPDASSLAFNTISNGTIRFYNGTDDEMMRLDALGRLGIGTISPSHPLDVAGANNTTFDHVGTISLLGTDAYNSGNAGAGINFGGKYNSSGDTTTLAQISGIKEDTGNGTFDGALTFGVRNDAEGVNIERVRIGSNGHVGIGTSSPGYKLDVKNNSATAYSSAASPSNVIARLTNGTTQTNSHASFLLNATNDNGAVDFWWMTCVSQSTNYDGFLAFSARTTSSASQELVRFANNGRVSMQVLALGSGNSHDSAKLVIQGSGNASNTNSVFIKNSDETPLFQVRNDGAFFTGIDGSSPYNLTTSSTSNLVHVTNEGVLKRSTSSARYKKDIADATFGLADVLKLKPKTFKNNNTGEFADDKTYAGFTAEDIHDLGLTEFVEYNEDNEPDSLAYGNMVALMAKAIQELNAKVAALEAA